MSVPRWRLAWAVAARCADSVRRRVDGDVGVSDLARGPAPPDPVADGHDRRRPVLRDRRPFVRYLERLASHDKGLRVLGRLRGRFFARIERWPQPSSAPIAREICSRGWSRTWTRSRTCTCADGAPARRGGRRRRVGRRGGRAAPAAGLVLAAGLLAGGVAVPALAGFPRRTCRLAGRTARSRAAVGRARRVAPRRVRARRVRCRGRGTRHASARPTGPWSRSPGATP